jgi:hypothetical protein
VHLPARDVRDGSRVAQALAGARAGAGNRIGGNALIGLMTLYFSWREKLASQRNGR